MYPLRPSRNKLSGTIAHSALNFWSQKVRNPGVLTLSHVRRWMSPTRRANTAAQVAAKKAWPRPGGLDTGFGQVRYAFVDGPHL